MATVDDVRALGTDLERSYPVSVHGRLKFRVGQLVSVTLRSSPARPPSPTR